MTAKGACNWASWFQRTTCFFQKCRFTGYLFDINQILWTHNPQPQYNGYISRIHPLNKCSPAAPQVPPDVSTCSSAVSACQAASASPTARLLEVVAAMAPAVTRETSEKGRAKFNGNVWQCEPVPTGFLGIVKWCRVLFLCSWLEALGKREVKKESAQFAFGPSPWGPWMIKITQTIPNHETTTVPLRVLAICHWPATPWQRSSSHPMRNDRIGLAHWRHLDGLYETIRGIPGTPIKGLYKIILYKKIMIYQKESECVW